MLSASRAQRGARLAGEPMPLVSALHPMYVLGALFRHQQLAMLVGRSGSQKSGFAMWLVTQWNLPTLYVSGDMSPFTASNRLASTYTGLTTKEITESAEANDMPPEWGTARDELVNGKLQKSPIQFMFNSSPSLEELGEELQAWAEYKDEYPAVIVIDNLLDVQPLSDSPLQSDREILLTLKTLKEKTGAFILVVHHAKDEGDSRFPGNARSIQNKLTQSPEIIISIALDQEDENNKIFRGAVVKNRSGKSSPEATKYFELVCDPDRTNFGPPNPEWGVLEEQQVEIPPDFQEPVEYDDDYVPEPTAEELAEMFGTPARVPPPLPEGMLPLPEKKPWQT